MAPLYSRQKHSEQLIPSISGDLSLPENDHVNQHGSDNDAPTIKLGGSRLNELAENWIFNDFPSVMRFSHSNLGDLVGTS